MAAAVAPTAPATEGSAGRAAIAGKTLRKDRWQRAPGISLVVLTAFVIYATYAAVINRNFYYKPYISPFYSPCLAFNCGATNNGNVGVPPHLAVFGPWWAISPAILILIFPLGFRLTCYYYRRAYYRAFWSSPRACGVAESHKTYTGETRFPLIMQNVHRYFFYAGLAFNAILSIDAILAFTTHVQGNHFGVGNIVLIVNAVLLWLYSLSCHSCRHIIGGRLKHFSRHPIRFKMWGFVSTLNKRHMQFAWASLIFVAFTDLYVRLACTGNLNWLGTNGKWI
jgi:hypothetical protein